MRNFFQMRLWILTILLGMALPFFLSGQPSRPAQRIERLQNQIEGVIRGVKGEVGVAAKHIETGEEMFINGDSYFPMATCFQSSCVCGSHGSDQGRTVRTRR